MEKGDVHQSKFLKVAEELNKSEELRRKIEGETKSTKEEKASIEGKLAKVKVETLEL